MRRLVETARQADISAQTGDFSAFSMLDEVTLSTVVALWDYAEAGVAGAREECRALLLRSIAACDYGGGE